MKCGSNIWRYQHTVVCVPTKKWLCKWRCSTEMAVHVETEVEIWYKCQNNEAGRESSTQKFGRGSRQAARHLTQWIWVNNGSFPPSHLVHTDLSPAAASHLNLPSRGCGLALAPARLGWRWWFSWLDKEGSSLVLGALRTPDPTPQVTNTGAGEKLADIVLGEDLATLPACTRWGECTEGGPGSKCCTKLTNSSVCPSIYISSVIHLRLFTVS